MNIWGPPSWFQVKSQTNTMQMDRNIVWWLWEQPSKQDAIKRQLLEEITKARAGNEATIHQDGQQHSSA